MRGFRSTTAPHDPAIYVRGPVDTATITYARTEVARAARTDLPVHHLKIKMAEYSGSGRPPLCVAQVNLEIDGRLIRRQAAAPTVGQAIDRITAALPPVLYRLSAHLACPPAVHDVSTAALTMDLRDYDFYLFTDDHDGNDRAVYRAGRTGYRLATLKAATPIDHAPNSPVEADSDPIPSHTLPEAIRHLDISGRAFLIFAGTATTRAEILYRRYDGHLGLVTPIW